MQYLAITATALDQQRITQDLLALIRKLGCNVDETHLSRLGNYFACILLVSGNWSTIAKLEDQLSSFNDDRCSLQCQRADVSKHEQPLLPYLVQIIAHDQVGLLYEIAQFFQSLEIIVNDIQLNRFVATQADTTLANMLISISVPTKINLTDLRERFLILCDELNIDGILEPEKR